MTDLSEHAGLIMALVKLSYVRGIPDVLTGRDIDIFVDINTQAPQQTTETFPQAYTLSYLCDAIYFCLIIKLTFQEFCEFRAKCGLLWCYDWVSIPMVYTQVVTLATYLFFIFTIVGRQKIDGYQGDKRMPSGRIVLDIDLYFPVYTVLQFFFYMGLLKVAEQLINPFGDDDEDFELNWLIDRHVKASFLGTDVLMNPERIAPLVKDFYWDKQDCPIPYTEAAIQFKKKTYRGSADEIT